ncbi:hypothetical protein DWU98_19065, partial [Dyella monticola]
MIYQRLAPVAWVTLFANKAPFMFVVSKQDHTACAHTMRTHHSPWKGMKRMSARASEAANGERANQGFHHHEAPNSGEDRARHRKTY